MFSSNTKESIRHRIYSILDVFTTVNHGRYLGLPSLVGRDKKQVFDFVKEKVRKKVQGWKNKLLSRAGKEILLSSVV